MNMSNSLMIVSLISIYIGYKSKKIYMKILSTIIAVLFAILTFK